MNVEMHDSRQGGGHLNSLMAYLAIGIFASIPVSIAIAEPLIFLCVLLWFIELRRPETRKGLVHSPYFVPVLAFVGIALFASAIGPRPATSLSRCHRLLILPLIFVVESLFGSDGRSRFNMEHLAWAFICGAVVLALYDMVRVPVQLAKGRELFDTGNMRDPQMFMAGLCILLGMVIRNRFGSRLRSGIAGSALLAVGIVIHFKRGVWLSFAAAAAFMSVLGRKWRVILILLICGLSLLAVPKVRERISMVRGEWQVEQGGRAALWTRVAPALLKEYPLGMGMRATKHEDLLGHTSYIQPNLNHLHNNLLQIAVEFGWAGAAVWSIWMILALVLFLKTSMRLHEAGHRLDGLALGVCGAFIGIMLNGVVEYNFGDSEILMLICALMGLSAALWTKTRRRS